jgi:hypothetical protein
VEFHHGGGINARNAVYGVYEHTAVAGIFFSVE